MNPLLELGRLGEKAAWLIKLLMELKDWVLGVFWEPRGYEKVKDKARNTWR